MLLQRFDQFSEFIKSNLSQEINTIMIFGIQVHFKITKKCIVKHCAKRGIGIKKLATMVIVR